MKNNPFPGLLTITEKLLAMVESDVSPVLTSTASMAFLLRLSVMLNQDRDQVFPAISLLALILLTETRLALAGVQAFRRRLWRGASGSTFFRFNDQTVR